MPEKRRDVRKYRRLEIRYGVDEPTKLAFIIDITRQGFFIQSGTVLPPGTRLRVLMNMGHGQQVGMEVCVQWAKRVPPQLVRAVKKAGMGVKIIAFQQGEAIYRSYCADL